MVDDMVAGQWEILKHRPDDDLRVTLGRVGETCYAAEPFRPILALGPHQSRKTTGLAVPSVLEWPGPAIVTSVGLDVIEQTIEARRRVGDVMIYEPSGVIAAWPERVGWSPLDSARTWDDAQWMANAMVDAGARELGSSLRFGRGDQNAYWYGAATKALAPHLFAAAANGYTMADVMRWVATQEEFEVRSLLQATGEDAAIAEADASWSQPDVSRSSIYGTLRVALSVWSKQGLQQAASADPRFYIDRFLDGRANTLYLCSPAGEQETYSPVLTSLLSLITRHLYTINHGFSSVTLGLRGLQAALDASSGRIRPVLLVLDDAASAAQTADLDVLASTSAKAAIQLVTIFNDLSQVESRFGALAARSIRNNHAAVLVMPGSRDPATADLVDANLRGEEVPGLAGSPPSSAVRRLPRGKALCLYDNLPPRIIDLRSSMTDRGLLAKRGLAGADE